MTKCLRCNVAEVSNGAHLCPTCTIANEAGREKAQAWAAIREATEAEWAEQRRAARVAAEAMQAKAAAIIATLPPPVVWGHERVHRAGTRIWDEVSRPEKMQMPREIAGLWFFPAHDPETGDFDGRWDWHPVGGRKPGDLGQEAADLLKPHGLKGEQ